VRKTSNYLRQALSNFRAAQSVTNRSAGLLYYYAALNFAKAELLDSHPRQIINKRIGHGLSFSPTAAKTVAGDHLKVVDGVFSLLYERRTGYALPKGTTLSIGRLLTQVPEIGFQIESVGFGACKVAGVYQMLCMDDSHSWLLLAATSDDQVNASVHSVSSRLFNKHFARVNQPSKWRDHFGLSRRYQQTLSFYESKIKVPAISARVHNRWATLALTGGIDELLGMTTSEGYDAWLAPSLYKTTMLAMPPELARYALTYYASSLVRYKPQMFDSHTFPEYAYLFDAISRELASPMLQDVLAAVRGRPTLFRSTGGLRV
jgi:hypothetical protein